MPTLKECINRFRNENPLPLEDRKTIPKESFWWVSSPTADVNKSTESAQSISSSFSTILSNNSDGVNSLLNSLNGDISMREILQERDMPEISSNSVTSSTELYNMDEKIASLKDKLRILSNNSIDTSIDLDNESIPLSITMQSDANPSVSIEGENNENTNNFEEYLDKYTNHLIDTCDALLERNSNLKGESGDEPVHDRYY